MRYTNRISYILDGLGGAVTTTAIRDSTGRTVGIRYSIYKTSMHDHGAYKCKLQNMFGVTESYKALHVQLNIIGGNGNESKYRNKKIII